MLTVAHPSDSPRPRSTRIHGPDPGRRVRRIVAALIQRGKRDLPKLTSDRIAEQRDSAELSAAGFSRCLALLESIYVLCGSKRGEAAGVLVRSLCETWAVALYLALKRDHGVLVLAQATVEEFERLAEAHGKAGAPDAEEGYKEAAAKFRRLAEHSPYRTPKKSLPRRLTTKALFRDALPPLMSDYAELAEVAYNHVYGPESTFSTHGGLATLYPWYVDKKQGRLRIPPLRPRSDAEIQAVSGFFVAFLGERVASLFGLDSSPYNECAKRLGTIRTIRR